MKPIAFLALAGLAATMLSCATSPAFDIAPFKVGDRPDTEAAKVLLAHYEQRPSQAWAVPGRKDLPGGAQGELIAYGIQILTNTSRTVGPNAPDKALRHSANNLNCTNCHQAGAEGLPGTKPYALPFVNVVNDYPKLDVKTMRVISLEDRILQMFGRGPVPLEKDSREMKAMVAYMSWLGSKARPNSRMAGTGLEEIPMPPRAADPRVGEGLFAQQCASCHSARGTGQQHPEFGQGAGYAIPPIAGDDTYTDGGHMYMVPLLTRFVHANMPLGSSAASPILTVEEAYDIAAYVNSELPRRHVPGREASYPDAAFRPAGFAIPELFQGDEAAYRAARFGPYKTGNP